MLTPKINRLISEGVKFEISAGAFEVFGVSDRERLELEAQKDGILCTLHQFALMQYLSLSDLQMFKDEVRERAAILSDGETLEPPFEIVAEIARDWFVDVLEELKGKKN